MKHYWTAPALWPDSTVVCIAGGPSLKPEQVEWVRGKVDDKGRKVRTIAINNAYLLAPWADVLYFCDDKWWQQYGHGKRLQDWQGMIVRLQGGQHDFGDKRIKVLRNLDQKGGLSKDRSGLHTGQNSGFQAINLAVHLGAKRILLLAYDMDAPVVNGRAKTHWFGDHPGGTSPRVYDVMLPWFATLVKPLADLGIEVVNCTGGGRLQCFKKMSIQEALPERVTA